MNETDPALWPPVRLSGAPSRYPYYGELSRRAAGWLGVDPEMVLPTAGASEGLLAAALAFVCPGRTRALTSTPTFSLIPGYLRMAGAGISGVPVRGDLTHHRKGMEARLALGVDIVVVASPDNPTGMALPAGLLREWARRFPGTLFVFDEAYGELGGQTMVPAASEMDNVLVLRSFSKAWGLAGLRLGLAVGNPGLLQALRRVRTPYAAGAAAVQAGLQRLQSADRLPGVVAAIHHRRRFLARALRGLELEVPDGCRANFLPVRVGPAAGRIATALRRRGILVRHLPHALPGWLRITAGREEETARLAEAMEEVLSKPDEEE
jgi:histidinol-phosphate aminotransferase